MSIPITLEQLEQEYCFAGQMSLFRTFRFIPISKTWQQVFQSLKGCNEKKAAEIQLCPFKALVRRKESSLYQVHSFVRAKDKKKPIILEYFQEE